MPNYDIVPMSTLSQNLLIAVLFIMIIGHDRGEIMNTISLRLPESLHKKVKALAKQDKMSINQFINAAIAEKVSALLTKAYIEERAKRGLRRNFKKRSQRLKTLNRIKAINCK
jgi:predicted transcriptional regulator